MRIIVTLCVHDAQSAATEQLVHLWRFTSIFEQYLSAKACPHQGSKGDTQNDKCLFRAAISGYLKILQTVENPLRLLLQVMGCFWDIH